MKVFLRTDMLTLTTPLEEYLDRPLRLARHREPRALGRLRGRPRRALRGEPCARRRADPHRRGRPRLRRARAGTTTPQLAVTTRRRRADDAHDAHRAGRGADREVIFRTWSVGVGAVGDMHTEPDSYEAVLGGIDSARAHRLDEVHARRLLQLAAAQRHARAGRRSAGSSSSRAGASSRTSAPSRTTSARVPVRAAAVPRREPEHRGHLDLDAGRRTVARRPDDAVSEGRVLAAVRAQHRARRALARDPETDAAAITADWARQWFSDDPATVARDRRGDGPLARGDQQGCTSGRSPSSASSRSASSRRP